MSRWINYSLNTITADVGPSYQHRSIELPSLLFVASVILQQCKHSFYFEGVKYRDMTHVLSMISLRLSAIFLDLDT